MQDYANKPEIQVCCKEHEACLHLKFASTALEQREERCQGGKVCLQMGTMCAALLDKSQDHHHAVCLPFAGATSKNDSGPFHRAARGPSLIPGKLDCEGEGTEVYGAQQCTLTLGGKVKDGRGTGIQGWGFFLVKACFLRGQGWLWHFLNVGILQQDV